MVALAPHACHLFVARVQIESFQAKLFVQPLNISIQNCGPTGYVDPSMFFTHNQLDNQDIIYIKKHNFPLHRRLPMNDLDRPFAWSSPFGTLTGPHLLKACPHDQAVPSLQSLAMNFQHLVIVLSEDIYIIVKPSVRPNILYLV